MGVTLKFQSSGSIPGNSGPVTMQGGSLTVGRGPANDLVLPDPDRQLSKSHFVIEDHNGNVQIVDLSTNGTFLNYSKIPLGRTPTPLNNGDVLVLGSYELIVEIGGNQAGFGDMIAPPLDEGGISPGSASQAPDPLALLDDAGPEGDFLDELLGPETPSGPAMLNPVDPIDELLPPAGEDETSPFFEHPVDGREGEGASIAAHNASATDSFRAQQNPGQATIPDDWDDMLEGIDGTPTASPPAPATPVPGPSPTSFAAQEAPPPPDPLSATQFPAASDDSDPFASAPAPQVPQPPRRRTPPVVPPVDPSAPDEMPETILPTGAVLSGAGDTAPPRLPQTPVSVASEPASDPADTPPVRGQVAGPGQPEIAARLSEALGAEHLTISPQDLPDTVNRMGRVMRTLITGLREILMTRSSIKSEFRIEQTMISAGGNNPLKFSVTPDQAIEAMVAPTRKGYLTAEAAAEQALEDIKAHEIAMVTGMEAALKGVLAKLDPKVLEDQIETKGGLGGLIKGKKARYWEVYEKMYAEISDQAENDFQDLFSREFARAYKEQLDKLKT